MRGDRHVVADGEAQEQRLLLAVLRHEADAGAMASAGVRSRTGLPSTRIVPWSNGSAPKMARAISVRPAPTRPARPRISPWCDRRARRRSARGMRIARVAAARETLDPQRDRPGSADRPLAVERADVAADHHADHARRRWSRRPRRRRRAAVAQHRGAVAEADHLVEPVRDEDDRRCPRPCSARTMIERAWRPRPRSAPRSARP